MSNRSQRCAPIMLGMLVGIVAAPGCGRRDEAKVDPPIDPNTWVPIVAGTANLGAPQGEDCRRDEPVPESVRIASDYAIGAYEVTQGQFEALMHYNPSFASMCSTCPVDSVSWHEAAAYANAVSRAAGLAECYGCTGADEDVECDVLPTCEGLRLPTDAEWEYAARAGTAGATYAGDLTACMGRDDIADQIAWYKANSSGQSHPAGEKSPNGWGLHDVLGNVAEWTQGRPGANQQELRGGSWYHNAERSRAASRLIVPADAHLSYAGFRLVRAPVGSSAP
jgi:formylglycine-generating enzyme required for sulfatase activity